MEPVNQVDSASYLSGVSKWGPASAREAGFGLYRWRGCARKTMRLLDSGEVLTKNTYTHYGLGLPFWVSQ